jgi:hypothetical protein
MSSPVKPNQTDARDDLIDRGQLLYRNMLAPILEPHHTTEFVAIEPQAGRYFLGRTATAALITAREQMSNSLFYLTRVGQEAAHHIGGNGRRDR